MEGNEFPPTDEEWWRDMKGVRDCDGNKKHKIKGKKPVGMLHF